jgi:predicted ATPase
MSKGIRCQALGENLEDPPLLFSVLFGISVTNFAAVKGEVQRELGAQFLALAEKQGATVPLMVGHRIMGIALTVTGEIAEAQAHYDQALALYRPVEHRPLAARFGQDTRVTVLSWRALASWMLGYPEKAVADTDHALKNAREIGQAATLMSALDYAYDAHILCGNYATANALLDELVVLADEKGAFHWKAAGLRLRIRADRQGCGGSPKSHLRNNSTPFKGTYNLDRYLSYLARAYAELGQFDDAWRSIDEAITAVETTEERWWEAEVLRTAGEIALKSPEPDAVKAEGYFEHALAVARQQQAKSWELRAAMSMARLWRDQGKPHEMRHAIFSARFMAGSLKGSTRLT